jgi:signal transduction histidine kinase
MLDTLRTGESAHIMHEHVLFGDSPTYCDLVTYPIKDKDGKIIKVIEISRDITDELSSRWEKRVKALKNDFKKLIQEDRMISLGKLVASSVHEINNPIQGLLTFTGVMRDILEGGTPDDEGLENFKAHLAIMSRELERCGNIVSGLLSFSRESGIHYENVDLNEILHQVIALTRHKMEIQQIELRAQIHSRPLMLNGDLHQLQQCFLNIIFNALESMPEGGRLTISSEPDGAVENALIQIQDTGCGIAGEDLEHIFDPFFTTKGEGEGTGLGLSITYGIVKNHGGEIEVHSQPGEGTAFVLKFSLVETPGY